MSVHLKDNEGTHRILYQAHWSMVRAGEQLHAAILALHAAGLHSDTRRQLAEPIAALDRAREMIDGALQAAGDGRAKLIRLTGCDATCSNAANINTAAQ